MTNPLVEFENSLLASKVAARVKQEVKMEVLPRDEVDEVNKHLVQAQYLVQEWVIRANQAQHRSDEYTPVSSAQIKAITKFRDDLDDLAEQVGPSGSKRLVSLKASSDSPQSKTAAGMRECTMAEYQQALAKAKWPEPRYMNSKRSMTKVYTDRGTEVAEMTEISTRGKKPQVMYMCNPDYLT